jgi:8-oxo-dGTP pyrophosphatase MutT (NUDIX family)
MALLVKDGRALLAHRHPSRRWYPNCWDLVGGHIEPGESPEQAVRRECHEEIGITVHALHPMPMTVSNPGIKAHAFVITAWDGEPTNAAPDEHDDLGWFAPTQLDGLVMAHPSSLPGIVHAIQHTSPRS